MSREALVARARGLSTRRAPALAGPPSAVEELLRARQTEDLAILRRWGGNAVAALELDEDRRTLRAIARGIVANASPVKRLFGAVPTSTLPPALLARVAEAASFADVHALLERHPLREAFDVDELFDVERALPRLFVAQIRTRDLALRTYRTQIVDVENAQAALALVVRGANLDPLSIFLDGGARVDRAVFAAAAASRDTARERLARVFEGTPIAAALFAAHPSAIEDAALAWQLATQARLRRVEPLGLAPVIWLALHRRDEARNARAAAWSAALGGPS
ncbi:MAG: V-type ATPase subunit [Kofleriaceae bacterium]